MEFKQYRAFDYYDKKARELLRAGCKQEADKLSGFLVKINPQSIISAKALGSPTDGLIELELASGAKLIVYASLDAFK